MTSASGRAPTLRQTVDMVRVAMEFFEQWLPALARNDRQLDDVMALHKPHSMAQVR